MFELIVDKVNASYIKHFRLAGHSRDQLIKK